MSDTTFYFTKYTIQSSLNTEATDEELRNSLANYVESANPVVVEEDESWHFGDTVHDGDKIIGKFGRSFTDNSTIYDESRGDFEDEAVENKKAEYSMFVLDIEHQILLYHSRNRLGHQQFKDHFEDGYERYMEGIATLEIELIRNKEDVDEIVEQYPVRRAEFRLRTSNPSPEPAWEDWDEEMRQMLAEKLDIDIESIDGGSLNFDEETLREIYEMSKTEYGEHEIVYDKNGELTVVSSTSSKPVQKREARPGSLDNLRSRADELISHALFFL